jgi:hypothetical protein
MTSANNGGRALAGGSPGMRRDEAITFRGHRDGRRDHIPDPGGQDAALAQRR